MKILLGFFIILFFVVLFFFIYDVVSNHLYAKHLDKDLRDFLLWSDYKNRTFTFIELGEFEFYLKTHFHGYEFFINKIQFINNEEVPFLFDNADEKDFEDFRKAIENTEYWKIADIAWINHNV